MGSEPPSSDLPARWVVVRRFIDAAEAQLARARLEDLGIDSHIEGESDTLMFAGGSIQVLVKSTDAERANATLEADALAEAPDDPLDTTPRCNACDSIYLEERYTHAQVLVGLLGLGLPLLFSKKRRVCRRCETPYVPALVADDGPYRRRMRREGNPVFRLRQHRGVEGGLAGFGLGAIVNLLTHGVPIGFIAGPLAGYLLGAGFGRSYCSNPKCRAALEDAATSCPRCGGAIVGRITASKQHFVRKAAWHRGEDQPED